MNPVRWGIIGPGKIANKFAVALTLAGDVRLDAVASRDAAKARAFADQYGAPRSYGSYEQLVSDPDIDAIYVATPHGFHLEHTLLSLRHGKAVLCEKPLALYEAQVEAMIAASRQHKTFLMEAMWARFTPNMLQIMDLVRQGRLGTIKYIRADFGFKGPWNPENRLFNPALGGGSLLDIGIYPLFLCLNLLGAPDHILASGHLASTGTDESCHALLQYQDGCTGIISSTFACQTSLTAEIAGTEGRIQLPSGWHRSDNLTLIRPGEEPQTIQSEPMVNGFEYQIREVTRCLAEGRIESPGMPHDFSLLLCRTMDQIRHQLGMKYPGES